MMSNLRCRVWRVLWRYIRFGLVGASGIVVDMAVLFVLADPRMLAINLSLSKMLAAEVALISNFIWNELWTFGDISASTRHWRARLKRLLKFNVICATGIGLSILLLNLQVRFIAMNVYEGNLIAILLVSVWNFGMNYKFGWNTSRKVETNDISDFADTCAQNGKDPAPVANYTVSEKSVT